jgi:hypothetical protein
MKTEMNQVSRRVKTFDCGHTGFGRFCHRCHADQLIKLERETAHLQKRQWQASFASDPIDLRCLPSPTLVTEARQAIHAITVLKQDYRRHGGKLLAQDRNVLSVHLNLRYRLLFERTQTGWVPRQCLTHEAYNTVVGR